MSIDYNVFDKFSLSPPQGTIFQIFCFSHFKREKKLPSQRKCSEFSQWRCMLWPFIEQHGLRLVKVNHIKLRGLWKIFVKSPLLKLVQGTIIQNSNLQISTYCDYLYSNVRREHFFKKKYSLWWNQMTQIASSKSKRFIQLAEYFRLHHKPIWNLRVYD